jgi:hypothetical protein
MRSSFSAPVARGVIAATAAVALTVIWAVGAWAGAAPTVGAGPGSRLPRIQAPRSGARARPGRVPAARYVDVRSGLRLQLPSAGAGRTDSTEAASSMGWRLAAVRHYGTAQDASGYSAVVAPGRSTAWAFGGTNPGGASAPVALQWNGSRWRSWWLPRRLTGFISDASAPSSRDIWAVSYAGGYVLHWNGTRWWVARRWRQHTALTGVTALSPTDVWVFGTTTAGVRGMGTWHYNGRSWTQVTGAASEIYRASAVSGHDIWAVAADHRGGFIEHYNGRAWRVADTGRALGRVRLDDVLAVSRTSVWVVGNLQDRQGDGRMILAHYDGKRWTMTVTPWRADTGRLAPAQSGGVWLTADNTGARNDALIGHLCRGCHPAWATVKWGLGSGISDVAVSRNGTVWLSGGFLTRAGSNAAVWSRRNRHARFDDDDIRFGGPLDYRSRHI